MSFVAAARPLTAVAPDERVAYLKKVLAWTAGGLMLSAFSAVAMMAVITAVPALWNQTAQLVIILGTWAIAQFVCRSMVFGSAKVPGFLLAAVAEGIAIGYLLLAAITLGAASGNPLGLVSTAMVLTGLTAGGMAAYVWTSPKDFSMLGAGLAALSVPMLILMAITFVFPSFLGGFVGTVVAGVFVAFSAGALLYQINAVIHQLRTDQHMEGAYLITMGILVLFWNLLVLLMKLRGGRR